MGKTLAEAYVNSYDVKKMTKASIYQSASRLMDDERIADRVRELSEAKTDRLMMADRIRVRQYVFDRLIEESRNTDNPAASRIKALELLGKVRGVELFEGGKEEPAGRKAVEIEEELKRKLAGLLGEHWNGARPEGPAE